MDARERELLHRLAAWLEEGATLLRELAGGRGREAVGGAVRLGGPGREDAASAAPDGEGSGAEDGCCVLRLLEARGVRVRRTLELEEGDRGLLTLAGLMGRKLAHVRPLLDRIKRAVAGGRRVQMDLSRCSQETVADVTLVAGLAHRAGLLYNYQYLKAPRFRLSFDVTAAETVTRFFTGRWLELFAVQALQRVEEGLGVRLPYLCGAEVELPNGDLFELDLVAALGGRLVWVEAKTAQDYAALLPKYRRISELLCPTAREAVLLWSELSGQDPMAATRGRLARMTPCAPGELQAYLEVLAREAVPGAGPPAEEAEG